MKTAGIYIHFPFCENRCIYCDYYSIEKQENDIGYFVKMLCQEIDLTAKNHKHDWQFDTIYFGGGSPALLSPNDIKYVLNKLKNHFNISENIELTLEVNPGETNKEQLYLFKELGINRLSIGFQSLDSEFLKTLSRIHNPDDCFTIYNDARDAGFDNISIDMMYNIPGQTICKWLDNLKTLIKLNCDHIAIFSLTLEKGTPFYNQVRLDKMDLPNFHTEEEMFTRGSQFLTDNIFTQYEVAHFTKLDKECLHNQHYWKLDPYLAFGPSANGYDGSRRWWNVSSLEDYYSKLSSNKKPVAGSETLNYSDRFNEAVIYGLRTKNGILTEKLQEFEYKGSLESSLKKWGDHLYISKEAICIKPGHFHLADEISTDMLLPD